MEQSYPALQSAKAQLQGLAAKYLCQSNVGVFAGYSFKVCNFDGVFVYIFLFKCLFHFQTYIKILQCIGIFCLKIMEGMGGWGWVRGTNLYNKKCSVHVYDDMRQPSKQYPVLPTSRTRAQ